MAELIMEIITKVYHKFSHLRFVAKLSKKYREGFPISNYMASRRMKRISQKKVAKGQVIKFVILAQSRQAWMKVRCVYDALVLDKRFEVRVVAIPSKSTYEINEMYEYLNSKYEGKVIDARTGKGWYDIEKESPDYVLYLEPYDSYLPKVYRSGRVSKYAKMLYIPYGFVLWDAIRSVSMSKLFMRNVYLFFSESSISKKYNVRQFPRTHELGYQKSVSVGYPVFQYFMGRGKAFDNVKKETCTVCWTPRWSENEDMGGSNFMTFKDKVVKLPQKNDTINLIFRPHPMTFSHFIEKQRITQKEVDVYLQQYRDNPALEYDNSNDYAETLWKTDILLTDISSIIIEYLLTGRPIVYCDTGVVPDEFFAEIIKCLYVVKTWEEAEEKVLELAQGVDIKKDQRREMIERLFGGEFDHIADRFIETLCEDAYN